MDDRQRSDVSEVLVATAPGSMSEEPVVATDHERHGRDDMSRQPERLLAVAPAPIQADGGTLDHYLHAWQAQFTGGLSPTGIALAWWDWALHLGNAPAKQMQLAETAIAEAARFAQDIAGIGLTGGGALKPDPADHRFRATPWHDAPFNVLARGFHLAEQWAKVSTTGVPGVRQRHERLVSFLARQWLEALSPANSPLTNPEVIGQTWRAGGGNLLLGAMNAWDDARRHVLPDADSPTAPYRVGVDIAATPGKVVFRNRLMELIQYAPATPTVKAEPVLLVPAWIMKYYILDLSGRNSLVRYLVEHGFTVFAISWRNPGAEERDIGLDDYRELGVMAALDAIGAIVPERRVHAAGYCLGGTLLAIAAAEMAREEDDRLASITLLTTQVDFTEAGELLTFISEDQIAFLEDEMWVRGYLDSSHMSGVFQALRADELVWAQAVRRYLLGEADCGNDLMAWNRDATRMPYRMQAEYLRQLFLGNDLARGRYLVDGRPLSLGDIKAPIFSVATEADHVAPWRSVYKIALLSGAELTFVLTKGGHNGGVVSEPGHPGRFYRLHRRAPGSAAIDADSWLALAARLEGSWWESWTGWLAERSSAADTAPPGFGSPEDGYPALSDAPGKYVLMR